MYIVLYIRMLTAHCELEYFLFDICLFVFILLQKTETFSKLGIGRLIGNGSYSAAYPLHEVGI